MMELFTPQQIPKTGRRPVELKVIQWRPGDPLPWNELPEAKPGKVWQHHVYLGVYNLSEIYETLRRLFNQDPEAHDLRVPGQSACAGLVLNEDGVLVGESVVLSSCAWALGKVNAGRHTRPGWSVDFEEAANDFQVAAVEKDEIRQDKARSESPVPVDDAFLRWLHREARQTSHVEDIASVLGNVVVIRSMQVYPSTAADLSEFDFMNSFFLDDLRAVQHAASNSDLGVALNQYLTPERTLDDGHRIDVVTNTTAVDAATGSAATPPGRWPSSPDHPLALSQQFAVNNALNHLGAGSGLMGINARPLLAAEAAVRRIEQASIPASRARWRAGQTQPTPRQA